jgi:hypothetical protein
MILFFHNSLPDKVKSFSRNNAVITLQFTKISYYLIYLFKENQTVTNDL